MGVRIVPFVLLLAALCTQSRAALLTKAGRYSGAPAFVWTVGGVSQHSASDKASSKVIYEVLRVPDASFACHHAKAASAFCQRLQQH